MEIERILHSASGLYCEFGHGPQNKETHIFLSKEDNVPLQICKSALEVAAFLGGYSRAVGEYLPVIIAAVSLAPKDGPTYKLLNDHIYRKESRYSVVPEPEIEQDSSKTKETGLIPRADWFVQVTGDNSEIVTAVKDNAKLRGDWISTRMAISGNGTEEDPYDLFVGEFLSDDLGEIKEILGLLYAAKAKGNRIDIELFCAVKIPDPKGDVLVMQVSIGSANAPFVDIMPGIRHFFQVWGG